MASKRKNDSNFGSQEKKGRYSGPDLSQCPDFHDNTTMNKEAEAGIVEKISLKNFMCHSNLEFSFGPHVNFLIGNNGSGKSAVLTAIMIGLGGKANITNRGNTLKNFIKTGKRSAEISITLRNWGPEAYRRDVYGDCIIIERKLSYDGAGSYKLKDSNSKVVDTRKDELIAILDHFSIQVDNPVAILTQEASKTFLHSKSSHDKYKFFLKATQLEQTKHDYVNAEESKRCASEIIKEKGKLLPEMEKEVMNWKQKFEACESLDSLKEKISDRKKELAWAIICEKKRDLLPISKDLKAETLRTPKFDQKVKESEAKVKESEDEYYRHQDEVKKRGENAEALKPKHLEARNVLAEKKSRVKKTQEDYRKICLERDSVASDKKQIEERIVELHQKDYSDYDKQRKVRLNQISNLELQLSDHHARLKTLDNDLAQFHGAISKIRQELSQTRLTETSVLSAIQRVETQLRNAESARVNTLSRYGSWMPEAIQRIDDAFRRGRFTKKPIGPIGANISLRDPKWALAIEVCLGVPLCTGFIVDNYNDEHVLEEILSQVCPQRTRKPSIFTSKFQPVLFNVPKNTSRYPSILDMLHIADPVLSNCIVDQRRIEEILLFESAAEARDVMRGQNRPKGFGQAYTIGGDHVICAPVFRFYSAEKSNAQLLTPSVEELIRQFRDELNQLNYQSQQSKTKLKNLMSDEQRNIREKEKVDVAVRKLRQGMSTIDMEIKELKNFEEPQPIDVSTLETEAKELEAKLLELKVKADDQCEKIAIAEQEKDSAEQLYCKLDKLIQDAGASLDPIKNRFAEIDNELEMAKEHLKHYAMKKKDHEKRLQQLQEKYDAKAAELQSDQEKALQICDEIETNRRTHDIEIEIKQIEKRIASEEKIRGDRNEIIQTYHQKRETYENVKKELSQIHNFLRKLEESLLIRNQWFCQQRESLSLRTRLLFAIFLSERNYSGTLEISHKDETIEPSIYPKAGSDTHTSSNKSLSGGERSFSTACFVLSLWDGTSSPFRCLDEYDVFMDMVNRRITMDMMMKFAARKTGSQFIFLSPLDISGVLNDPGQLRVNMKIFEMQPPERGLSQFANEEEED